jgi:hypothetical protein
MPPSTGAFTPMSGIVTMSSIFDPSPSVVKQPLFFAAGLKPKRSTVLERGVYEELLRQPMRDSQLCMGEAIYSHKFRGSSKAPTRMLRKKSPGVSTGKRCTSSSSITDHTRINGSRDESYVLGDQTFIQLLKQPRQDQELCLGEAIHKYNHKGRGLERREDAEYLKKQETMRRRKEYSKRVNIQNKTACSPIQMEL